MATKIDGWVLPLPGSGGLRDWSTFTTTFPGPNSGYMKVFGIQSCCPGTEPVIQPCDIFFSEGSKIVIMRDLGDTEVLVSGPTPYVDTAVLNGKLYARKFDGYLDEYTIGATSLTLTTPNIVNLNTGVGLGTDGSYLIYDINSGADAGKIARTVPGTWTPQIFSLADPVTLQGDIILVGGNRLAMTTTDDISSLLIIDNNPTTPTIHSNSQIKDNIGNTLSPIKSSFQKNGVLYIIRADGVYYSMSTTWPLVFTQQGQLLVSGTAYGDWSGSAQEFECGTVTPPDPPDTGVVFTGAITNNGIPQPGVFISGGLFDDSIQNELTAPTLDMSSSNTFNGMTVTNSVGPYRIRFTNDGSSTTIITASILVNVDGGGFTEIDNPTLTIGESYDHSFGITATNSIAFIVVVSRVPDTIGYSVLITNDSIPAVSGVTLTNITLRGPSTTIIAPYTIDLDDVPPSDTHTGSDDFQAVDFEFEVGDIPATKADIYISTDGAPDVIVGTEFIPSTSTYIKHFAQAALATTSFKITYKFKQDLS